MAMVTQRRLRLCNQPLIRATPEPLLVSKINEILALELCIRIIADYLEVHKWPTVMVVNREARKVLKKCYPDAIRKCVLPTQILKRHVMKRSQSKNVSMLTVAIEHVEIPSPEFLSRITVNYLDILKWPVMMDVSRRACNAIVLEFQFARSELSDSNYKTCKHYCTICGWITGNIETGGPLCEECGISSICSYCARSVHGMHLCDLCVSLHDLAPVRKWQQEFVSPIYDLLDIMDWSGIFVSSVSIIFHYWKKCIRPFTEFDVPKSVLNWWSLKESECG